MLAAQEYELIAEGAAVTVSAAIVNDTRRIVL